MLQLQEVQDKSKYKVVEIKVKNKNQAVQKRPEKA